MKKCKETKSRNSVTKDFGGRVQVRTKIPSNTCRPGQNVEFRTQEKPYPTWNCAKCGKVLLVEKTVNAAMVRDFEYGFPVAGAPMPLKYGYTRVSTDAQSSYCHPVLR
jgi:hypothetical protein